MTEETWRVIPEWPSYEASDHGRIRRATAYRSTTVGKVLSPYLLKDYPAVCFRVAGTRKQITVHRLVMLAFVGPPPAGQQVNHIDGCKTNNRLENLEYVTPSENQLHAMRTGLSPDAMTRTQELRAHPRGPIPLEHRPWGDRNGARLHPERLARGSRHHAAKLTEDDVRQIRRLLEAGDMQRRIAEKFGVNESIVMRIKKGRIWTHVV